MLGEHPIAPVLLAKDLAAAREFYHGKLGLQIERENESAIVFKCGSDTHLDVTKSTTGTPDQQTQAAWQVSDIRAEVAELRARSVKVEDYDTPGLLRGRFAPPDPPARSQNPAAIRDRERTQRAPGNGKHHSISPNWPLAVTDGCR